VKKLIFFIFLFFVFFSKAQDKTDLYIEKYKDLAISEMQRYGIPASITLAQGILESGNGESYLAVEGFNHFGIKCHKEWNGLTILADDDKKGECFRKYTSVAESYQDHSLFLVHKDRYSFLFNYKIKDYKKWARGLKKAGYATNPEYSRLLIDLIERYNLNQFDRIKKINIYSVYSFGFPYVVGYGVYFDRSGARWLSNRSLRIDVKISGVLNSLSITHDQYITDEFFVSTNTGLVYYPLKESKELLPTVSVTLGFKKLLPAHYKSDYFLTRLGLEFIEREEGVYSRDIWKDIWNDYYILPFVSFSYLIN